MPSYENLSFEFFKAIIFSGINLLSDIRVSIKP